MRLIYADICFFMISNCLKRNRVYARLIILIILFVVEWTIQYSFFFIDLWFLYSLNIFFSVWRIFQFYNLFFIFLIEKRRVNLIRCINIISLFYLYIFALFFKTDLKTIKMIFRLNLIGNISILKLIIPIDCSGHNFMSWKSILLRDLAIYTLQLCGFISIYFLYFQCFLIFFLFNLLLSLLFFLNALWSLRISFNYFNLVVNLKLIWIVLIIVDYLYIFNV